MSNSINFLFPTEVQPARPFTTSHKASPRETLGVNGYQKLKQVKMQAKQVQKHYQRELINHHKVLRSVEEVTRKSLLKRMEFLKIYANKKAKYQGRQMLQSCKRETEMLERKSIDMTKRRKLENELQLILMRNEEDDRAMKMQMLNRKEKQLLSKRLQITINRQKAAQLHQQVKKGHTQFLIRKKNIQTAVQIRSKRNYMQKINQQLSLIQHYQGIITQIQGMTLIHGQTIPLQTIDQPGKSFFTTSNTISV